LAGCRKSLKEHGEILIFSMDTNVLLKSPAYGNSIKYTVICEGELKDGQQFKVRFGGWENTDTHWSPSFLAKLLEEQGFKTGVEYVERQVISSICYSEEEKDEIEEARCIYVLRAKL
jgi:hypothetical protein